MSHAVTTTKYEQEFKEEIFPHLCIYDFFLCIYVHAYAHCLEINKLMLLSLHIAQFTRNFS